MMANPISSLKIGDTIHEIKDASCRDELISLRNSLQTAISVLDANIGTLSSALNDTIDSIYALSTSVTAIINDSSVTDSNTFSSQKIMAELSVSVSTNIDGTYSLIVGQ